MNSKDFTNNSLIVFYALDPETTSINTWPANSVHKSIKMVALALGGGNVRAMQRFVSDGPWDGDKIMHKYSCYVNDDLGSLDGALIFDE